MSLRFHWSLSRVGDNLRGARPAAQQTGMLSFDAQVDFCRQAERCGIDSVLMAFSFTRPDPTLLSMALGMRTERLKFMIAIRSGVISPTLFVQQVNTIASITNGRVCLNIVTGHTPGELRYYGDFLPHDERYARTDEFLTICRDLWRRDGEVNFEGKYYRIENGKVNLPFLAPDRTTPEIFLGGNSEQANQLAVKHADCIWRYPNAPEQMAPEIKSITATGTEVGLLVSVIARPTRDEAIGHAQALLGTVGAKAKEFQQEALRRSDSVGIRNNFRLAQNESSEWLTRCLWTGAIPYLGAPAIALVGSYDDIASAMIEYKSIGVSQFLLMGWPDLEEMILFSREVLPIVRNMENEATANLGGRLNRLRKIS